MNTDLPLKQVCITPPNLPVHNPFLDWAPESVGLAPPASEPEVAPVQNEEVEIEEDVGGAQELPSEQSVSPLPFRMGPTPPLVKSIIPTGEVKRGYPRGDITLVQRPSFNHAYTGPSMYTWPQVVSILTL